MGWSILYLLSFKHHWPLAMIQLNCVVASTAPTVWLLNSIPFRFQYLIWTSILIQPKILKEAKLHGKTESALLMRWYSTTYEQSWKKTVKIRQCCNFFSFVQIRLNNSASSIVQAQISHPFLLLLKPSLGAEWIVEWKEFLSKVPVCRATLPPLPRLASPRPAAPPPTYFEWRDVWNFVWIAVKWEIWVLTRKAFTRFAYAPRRLRAAFSRQLKSSFPLLTQKEFGEGDNFPKRVGSSHGG